MYVGLNEEYQIIICKVYPVCWHWFIVLLQNFSFTKVTVELFAVFRFYTTARLMSPFLALSTLISSSLFRFWIREFVVVFILFFLTTVIVGCHSENIFNSEFKVKSHICNASWIKRDTIPFCQTIGYPVLSD